MATTATIATSGKAEDRELTQDVFSQAFNFGGLPAWKFVFHNDLVGDWEGADKSKRYMGITFSLVKDGKTEELGHVLFHRDIFPISRNRKPVYESRTATGERCYVEFKDDFHLKAYELLTDGVKRQESEALQALVNYMNEQLPATIIVEPATRLSKKGHLYDFPVFCFNRKK